MEFYRSNDNLCFRDATNVVHVIRDVTHIPVRTFHVKGNGACYTGMNSKDRAVIEKFTEALASGVFRLKGDFTCANSLYIGLRTPSLQINSSRPVPILFTETKTLRGSVNDQLVTKGRNDFNVHRCHLGGSTDIELVKNVLYMVGGGPGKALTSYSSFEDRISAIYDIESRKDLATCFGLWAMLTRNLYIVSNSQKILAIEMIVYPGEKYILHKGMGNSERKLYHMLRRVDNAEKGKLLVTVDDIRVYSQPGDHFAGITAFVEFGFEGTGTEISVFSEKLQRLKRVAKHRKRPMDVKEIATLLQSTQRQVLAYLSRTQIYMDNLYGRTTHVGDAGSGELFFECTRKHRIKKLLGFTLIRLGDQVFRLADGKVLYIECRESGRLTADPKSGAPLGIEEMNLLVG